MGAAMKYLMESDHEGDRLQTKHDSSATRKQLVECGIGELKTGAQIVDAGSGIGLVAEDIYSFLKNKDPIITLIDSSSRRMEHARQHLAELSPKNFQFIECDMYNLDYPDNKADFVFSRFVFEYLSKPEKAFEEIYRITKPGGKIAIADLDLNCLNHYPLDEDLEAALIEIDKVLAESKMLDSRAGRKIYSLFHNYSLKNIKIDITAHHCFYGPLKEADLLNWTAKLEQIQGLANMGAMKFSFDIDDFSKRFIEFLKRPDRFSYTPMVTVTGVK